MTAIHGERRTFGQRDGREVQLVVFGDELYARYETPEGYSAVYDDERGVFTYARLVDDAFLSSGVLVDAPPPPDAVLHGRESDDVRHAKSAAAHARKFPSQTIREGGSHERDSR
jgi:hypothetical protein